MINNMPIKLSLFSVQDHHPDLPRTQKEFYDETMKQGVLADELGFDTFFVAEHHFHEYGISPNPALFLTALAQHTKQIRLGPAVSVLPFRNPLLVAEDYAMLDLLSGGRCVLGVGSGYLVHEFAGFNVDGKEKRERFDEALHLLRLALQGERITFQGKYHQVNDVAINVFAVQKPHPPIYVAVLRKEAAYYVGRQGNPLISIPYASVGSFEEIAPLVMEYDRGHAERAAEGGTHEAIVAFHTYVAESDAAARQEAADPFDLYVATRLYARRQTYDDIIHSGLALFGSVETVADKLVRLYQMGVRHVAMLHNFGKLDHDLVMRSIKRIANEVAPRVAEQVS
ncbi:MAG: LLM class flavin-dependent oxidoreductase [Ardenticatenaceae bacterium]